MKKPLLQPDLSMLSPAQRQALLLLIDGSTSGDLTAVMHAHHIATEMRKVLEIVLDQCRRQERELVQKIALPPTGEA